MDRIHRILEKNPFIQVFCSLVFFCIILFFCIMPIYTPQDDRIHRILEIRFSRYFFFLEQCFSVIRLDIFLVQNDASEKGLGYRVKTNWPSGDFFLFFATNFFHIIGNLTSETKFWRKKMTFGGTWLLAGLFSRPFAFQEK